MEQKLPPHDVDAEEAVIGSCLLDGRAFIQAAPLVNAGDFYTERCSFCWQAMKRLADREEAIDTITVASELNNMGKLEEVGGAAYLQHLIGIVPTSLDVEHYAKIVVRCSQARKLIDAAGKIANLAYTAGADIRTALKKAQELIVSMAGESIRPLVYTPREVAEYGMERYSHFGEKGDETAIAYGLGDLDDITGGAHKGDFVLIGGRPGMGKSALAQTLANNIAHQHHAVLYCSLEMTLAQFLDRDVVAAVKQPIQVISRGKYGDELFGKIVEFMGPLSERKLYFFRCEGGPVTTADIRAAVARLKLEMDLDVVFLDYLGLLADEYGNTQNDRIGYISRNLKNIARAYNVSLIAVSQLSRAVEKEFNKRPRLSDLRESGNLEQDADVVMFLYRDDYYYKSEEEWDEAVNKSGNKWKAKGDRKPYPKGIAELSVEKQRQRESGIVVKLSWNGKLMQFTDYHPPEELEPQLPLE